MHHKHIFLCLIMLFPWHFLYSQHEILELDGKDFTEHLSTTENLKTLNFPIKSIPIQQADPFIAISVVWSMDAPFNPSQKCWLGVGNQSGAWSSFYPLFIDPHSKIEAGRFISNLVFADKNATQFRLYFQTPSDQLIDLTSIEIHFFNPQKTINNPNPTTNPINRACVCPQPAYLNRSDWCPNGNCPEDATPVFTDATHMIVHHTATANTATDWSATVRAIWDFHVNTNGWDDVGYNWLIDPEGNLYEGRGDGRLGAHFCGTNGGTVGIAMLGNFETGNISASEAAKETLEQLLAWKTCDVDISPLGEGFHTSSGQTLMRISGHRDGCSTTCPGSNFYPELATIRQNVQTQQENDCIEGLATPVLDGAIIDFGLIQLNWTDDSAIEDSFIVERALDMGNFVPIASLPSNNNTFDDTNILPSNLYRYRVKAIANNIGESNYSNVVSFLTEASSTSNPLNKTSVSIFPNPNKGQFQVQIESTFKGSIGFQVFNSIGRAVSPLINMQKRHQQFNHLFNLTYLAKGVYYLKVEQAGYLAWFSLNIN